MFRRRADAPAPRLAGTGVAQAERPAAPRAPGRATAPATQTPPGRKASGPFADLVRHLMLGCAEDWVERYGRDGFEVAAADHPGRGQQAGQPIIYRCRAATRLELPGGAIEPGDHLVYLARTGGQPVVGQVVVFESGDFVADGKPRMAFGRMVAATDGVLQIEAFSPDDHEVTPMLFDETVLRGPLIATIREVTRK